ncbi:MAG: hypothetical protein ACRD72_25695, partial [Candidatus Angelobacter sp.]
SYTGALDIGYHLAFFSRVVRPYILAVLLSLALLVLFLRLARSQKFLQDAGVALLGPIKRHRSDWRWFGIGLAAVALSLSFIESTNHYFFVQDDNLSQFMPVMMQGGESLLNGIFPVWNPYQYLGMPTCTVGTYALTYPPTYVSYAIADRILHAPLCFLEVFAALHLLGGYAVMYALARRLNVRPFISMLAGVSFALNGYFLIVGRSW